MKKISLALILGFYAVSSFAGNSSTVGPGAPQLRYRCESDDQAVSAVVYRMWPAYDKDRLAVSWNGEYIETAVLQDSPVAGGSLAFVSEHFSLSVAATSPIYVNNATLVKAALQSRSNSESAVSLTCKVL